MPISPSMEIDTRELVKNGGFDTDLAHWSQLQLETFAWDAGTVHFVETGASWSFFQQDIGLIAGRKYKYSIDFTKNSGGAINIEEVGGASVIAIFTTSGHKVGVFKSLVGGVFRVRVRGAAADWNADNISVKRASI